MASQVAVQARSPDPQDLRGPQPVALAHLENQQDVLLLHFFERTVGSPAAYPPSPNSCTPPVSAGSAG